MAGVEKIKIKKVKEEVNKNWTLIELLEPIAVKINGKTETISKISIRGGTINKEGAEYKEGNEIYFQSPIADGQIELRTLLLDQTKKMVIKNKDRTITLEVRETVEGKVIGWINDDFNITIDYAGHIVNPDEYHGTINKQNVNFEIIFQKIKNYVQEHPNQFALSESTIHAKMPRGVPRLWWNSTNPEKDQLLSIAYETGDGAAGAMRQMVVTRSDGSKRCLHPHSFSKERYEELKNLFPDNRTCKVSGCYNNYCRFGGNEAEDTRVENGLCGYHRAKQEGRLDEHTQDNEENEQNNHTESDDIRETINQARNTYENSSNLAEINQAITALEDVKTNNNEVFNNWLGEEVLEGLKNKKLALELNQGNENPGAGNNNGESPETTPSNNANSALQTAKNNAIREITNALVNQEPKLTTKHDLSEINQDWKKKINSADNEEDVTSIRDRVMADIVAKRKAKKEAENIVNNLETEGKNAEQLKKQLEEVEKSKGQQSYEDNQSGIDNLKDELSKKVSQEEYCQIIVNTIEKNMAKYDIKSNELTPEVKKELERLKSGEIKDKNQINEIEKKVAKNVGEKGSEKKLNLILIESMEALNSGKKDKIKKAKDKLNNFLFSTDIYEKTLLSQRENDIKQALKNLENYSAQKQNNSDKFPWKVVIPASLFVLAFLGIIIYLKRKKRSKL